jgi:hypothetical protein
MNVGFTRTQWGTRPERRCKPESLAQDRELCRDRGRRLRNRFHYSSSPGMRRLTRPWVRDFSSKSA